MKVARTSYPPLHCRIPHVGSLRAEEQVVGPDAGRVIAAVEDMLRLRDRAVGEQPSDAVSTIHSSLAMPRRNADHAVAMRCAGSDPHPTLARLIHLLPEPISKWASRTRAVTRHAPLYQWSKG